MLVGDLDQIRRQHMSVRTNDTRNIKGADLSKRFTALFFVQTLQQVEEFRIPEQLNTVEREQIGKARQCELGAVEILVRDEVVEAHLSRHGLEIYRAGEQFADSDRLLDDRRGRADRWHVRG